MEGALALDVPLVVDARLGRRLGRGPLKAGGLLAEVIRRALLSAGGPWHSAIVSAKMSVSEVDERAPLRVPVPEGGRFELIRKFSDSAAYGLPHLRAGHPEAPVGPRDPVQGHGLVHHRLRPSKSVGTAASEGAVEGGDGTSSKATAPRRTRLQDSVQGALRRTALPSNPSAQGRRVEQLLRRTAPRRAK